MPHFHLSLGVHSLDASEKFFSDILGARIVHRDATGYVNIDLFGTQITLKQNSAVQPELPDFHFGVNLALAGFEVLAQQIQARASSSIVVAPETWDAGTPLERRKMYLKCPTGYLIEIKGYRSRP